MILSFLLLPLMVGSSGLFSIAVSSNYITLVMNQIYIYVLFRRIQGINSLYDKIMSRLSLKTFIRKYFLLVIISILVYFIMLYGFIYLLAGVEQVYIAPFVFFMIMNFCNFMIQELISVTMIGNKKKGKWIALPVFLNLFFHYGIANYFVSLFI